ncbi:MAG: NAD(+) synthase [Gemmatimonadetes bacterium]|nr:NAD(+) synthase [Gemmatimonadota bacterium]
MSMPAGRAVPQPLLGNPDAEIARIASALRKTLAETLGRRGFVVAISGGIDSAVCAGLAARAVGPARVFGLLLPEHESDPLSTRLGRAVADAFGIPTVVEEIGPTLAALGCYARRDEAIRRVVPAFGPGWGCKIVTPTDRLEADSLNVPSLLVQPPDGEAQRVPLPAREYREIIAATNFKQRVRKLMDYYHADRLHYAVIGTPNRLEYDQGFFVKGGDGLADVKPIAHLYKSQVYQLGAVLGVPEEILQRTPTTDTFSLPQTQEEFFFGLPYTTLDAVLHARNAGWSVAEAAERLGLPPEAVERAWSDLAQKRATTRYLHLHSLLVEPVDLGEGAPG